MIDLHALQAAGREKYSAFEKASVQRAEFMRNVQLELHRIDGEVDIARAEFIKSACEWEIAITNVLTNLEALDLKLRD